MRNLIDAQTLFQRLDDPNLVVIDTRFDLKDPDAGRRHYLDGHISGAVYLHLDDDLSGTPQQHGGRHPLPDTDAFVTTLEQVGIGNDSHVVVYDDSGGLFAGRLWWMLKYLGHDAVQLLDGGLSAWRAGDYPTTEEVPRPLRADFTPHLRPEMVADIDEVKRKLEDPSTLLVDARGPDRYRGDNEPMDPKAGHIPSAINLPFAGNLEGGRFKDPAALEERFEMVSEAEEVIVYCGSGVSAAHNVLVLDDLGKKDVKLYVGSWSDWSSYDENPVETGES